MFRPYLGSSYASALELLPRLLLGAILVNTAGWWVRLAIDVNNAMCSVFGAGPPPNLADTLAHSMPPTELLIGLIYVVMGLLLVLQQLMRLALVDVLIILAPLAAVCWILPQSHGWGRLWDSLFVGTVFAQAVQVLALRVGFNLTTDIPLHPRAWSSPHPALASISRSSTPAITSAAGSSTIGGDSFSPGGLGLMLFDSALSTLSWSWSDQAPSNPFRKEPTHARRDPDRHRSARGPQLQARWLVAWPELLRRRW